jgi:glycerol-3-phosphate acyltransferase PlsX
LKRRAKLSLLTLQPMRIAVDAMGGDKAPGEIVAGALDAARHLGVEVILVGDEAAIRACLPGGGSTLPPGVALHPASQVVAMDEAPSQAQRKKKDSSVAVAIRLHAEGKADAVLSAGNTGAVAAFALFTLKKIAGIDRPGIATVFPTMRHPLVLLDAGANVDCRPRHLADFALMGAVYARTISGIIPGTQARFKSEDELPSVGLLSIGEEECKGNDLTRHSYKLLEENQACGLYQFAGNVEGRDIGAGTVDVVVCDGFVGNVVLKAAEGFARMIGDSLRRNLTANLRSKLGALLLRPALARFKKGIDHTDYGGAVLLGVDGVCIICHGSSDARSIFSAIRIAKQTVATNTVGKIRAVTEAVRAGESSLDDALSNGQSTPPLSENSPLLDPDRTGEVNVNFADLNSL